MSIVDRVLWLARVDNHQSSLLISEPYLEGLHIEKPDSFHRVESETLILACQIIQLIYALLERVRIPLELEV